MVTPNQFKNGLTIEYEGGIYVIVEYQPVKPGKGGAFTRTKMRNLRTKKILDRTFRVEERFEEAYVDEKRMQFLYSAAGTYHFMEQDTYEEFSLEKEAIGPAVDYLKENMEVSVIIYKHEILEVKLPVFVILKIEHTEPGIKGDTAKSSFKPATLETGAVVQVPLFINEGDMIKIDTRTGAYSERA